jgi:hypothetical protein
MTTVHSGFRWSALAAGILVCATVAGCATSAADTRSHMWTGLAHLIAGARNGRTSADLDLVSSASSVSIAVGTRRDRLYEATTPAGADVAPIAVVNGDVVQLSLAFTRGRDEAAVRVSLSSAVDWRIRLDGGAVVETVNLTGGRLRELDLGVGSTRVDATLPTPVGAVPVTMAGGGGDLRLHLPRGVPADVALAGHAGSATIDGTSRSGVAGGTRLSAAGWTDSVDRYEISAAGVAALTLDRA